MERYLRAPVDRSRAVGQGYFLTSSIHLDTIVVSKWMLRRFTVNDATLLIKKMPADLKLWLAHEAARNDRSMNKETIRLLEEARALRENAPKPERDHKAIEQILKDLRALPVMDKRPMDEVLYDEAGMPK